MKKDWLPPAEAFSLPAATALFGFVAGSVVGSQERSLRYTVEHAHKKPKDARGWYFYHRDKQAKSIVAGVYRGCRYAALFGAFFSVWRLLHYAAAFQIKRFDVPRQDIAQQAIAGGTAGMGSGILWSLLSIYFCLNDVLTL